MNTVFDELLSGLKSYLAGFGDEPARNFIAGVGWSMPARKLAPRGLPCLVHLDRAFETTGEESKPLVRLLRDHGNEFHWGQTYTAADFGQ